MCECAAQISNSRFSVRVFGIIKEICQILTKYNRDLQVFPLSGAKRICRKISKYENYVCVCLFSRMVVTFFPLIIFNASEKPHHQNIKSL